MKNKNEIRDAVIEIMNQRMKNPTSFEQVFAPQMVDLGISRLCFDPFTNEMTFYTDGEFICSVSLANYIESQKQHPWICGKSFNIPSLQNAISKYDAGNSSSMEFHKEIFEAGVVNCLVYFKAKKIYYMGQDGNHYLENY